MSYTASQWTSGTPAPDLSNVLQLATRAGRLSGLNDFNAALAKQRESEIKKQQAANKQIAKQAAASNPNEPGFWSRVGQFALSGLQHTMDLLSTFDYAGANALDYLAKHQSSHDSYEDSFWHKVAAANPMGIDWLNVAQNFQPSDIGGVANAAWKGFEGGFGGKTKTTYADVIATAAKKDKAHTIQDNGIYQGAVGLLGDIALDPLSYVGVGIISKPMAALRGADHANVIAKADDGLVHDVLKLGLHRKTPSGEVIPVDEHAVRALLGETPKGQHPLGLAAENKLAIEHRIRGYQNLKKAIAQSPVAVDKTQVAKDLEKAISEHAGQLHESLNSYTKGVYKRALSDYKKGKIGDAEKAVAHVDQTLTKAVTAKALSDFMEAERKLKVLKNPDAYNTMLQQRDRALSGWWHSPALSPEFKSKLVEQVDHLTEGVPRRNAAGKVVGHYGGDAEFRKLASQQATINRNMVAKIDSAKHLHGKNLEEANREIVQMNGKIASIEKRKNLIKGLVAKNLIRHHLGQIKVPKDIATEWDTLTQRQKEIQAQVHAIASSLDNQSTAYTSADNISENAGNNELKSLQREWETNNKRLNEIQHTYLRDRGKVTPDNPEAWNQTIENKITDRAEEIYHRLVDSFTANRRESGLLPKDLRGMFGGKNDREPIVKIDGQAVTKRDKAALASHVTDEDRELANEYSQHFNFADRSIKTEAQTNTVFIRGKQYNVTHHIGYVEIEGGKKGLAEFESLTPSNVVIEGDNVLISTKQALEIKPEWVTFDRMFKDQHGITLRDALRKRNHAEGRVLPVGPKKHLLDKEEFVAYVRQHPKFASASGFGWKITIDGVPGVQRTKFLANGHTEQEWDDAFKNWVKTTPFNDVNEKARKVWESRYNRELNVKNAKNTANAKDFKPIPEKSLRDKAKEIASQEIHEELADTTELTNISGLGDAVDVPLTDISPKELHDAAIAEEATNYAQAKAAARYEAEKLNPKGKRKELATKLEELKAEHQAAMEDLGKAYTEATQAREEMAKRLDEQITLNLIQSTSSHVRPHLRVSTAGISSNIDIPIPKLLTAATERLSGIGILQGASKVWSDAFKPASRLEPELNEARLLAQNRTPELIKHDIDSIRHAFQGTDLSLRKNALKLFRKGMPVGDSTDHSVKTVADFFDDYTKYVKGKLVVGDEPMTAYKLNKFLPDKYKIAQPKHGSIDNLDLSTGEKLLANLKNMPEDTDPAEALFQMHIAAQQAMSKQALEYTIKNTFGVKREFLGKVKDARDLSPDALMRDQLVESLRDRHGWVTVKALGDSHFFAPEVAEQVNHLLDMMKPQNVSKMIRLYDKIIRAWKSSVTIYNPGYYTRNGIGEAMMSAFDGVMNPKHYNRAASILKYAMPDQVNEALKTLEPWKNFASPAQLGSRKVVRLKHGKQLSAEEVWVLYHQTGLKSGFISTEYEHYFPSLGSLKSSPVGRTATKINDAMRKGGEKYEDYFRLAHFISRLERSGFRDVEKAAQDAARYVRKFHFDYTDFTPFEKSVMMRVFPFYKWTRKAVPLMASMIYARPGLVMVYPKTMQAVSYATGGSQPLADKNGFYPNYEKVVPAWMKSMMAYPIGKDQQGAMDYMNIANPQFDIFKMLQDPSGTVLSMLSPGIKVPIEQLSGTTIDPGFQQKLKTPGDRFGELVRTTPATSFLSKIVKSANPTINPKTGKPEPTDSPITEPGAPMDEVLASFLSGLGTYENNKKRQKGELYRRYLQQSGL